MQNIQNSSHTPSWTQSMENSIAQQKKKVGSTTTGVQVVSRNKVIIIGKIEFPDEQ